ncbi:hypothetical protein MTR67_044988 [Solanum verrucosum]|uniref:Uncharacterized protein n=1 Tax=Solanum verrucosum TaxID=315347 RepID=A0AAF0ZVS1_SOLVR|nr:hypothetical protein MTR67_044988 [Solanum verrucosum]
MMAERSYSFTSQGSDLKGSAAWQTVKLWNLKLNLVTMVVLRLSMLPAQMVLLLKEDLVTVEEAGGMVEVMVVTAVVVGMEVMGVMVAGGMVEVVEEEEERDAINAGKKGISLENVPREAAMAEAVLEDMVVAAVEVEAAEAASNVGKKGILLVNAPTAATAED